MPPEPEGTEDLQPQEGSETGTPDTVSLEKYNELLIQAQSSQEKAQLLDELLADPQFQTFVNAAPEDRGKEPVKALPAKAPPNQPDLVATLQEAIRPLKEDIASMKETYTKDQEVSWANEAQREIKVMSTDKENFPFFKEVSEEMTKLMESGRALNLTDAYRLAAFGKAEAQGRSKILNKKAKQVGILPDKQREVDNKDAGKAALSPGGKRSLRSILDDAADKIGLDIAEGEEGD